MHVSMLFTCKINLFSIIDCVCNGSKNASVRNLTQFVRTIIVGLQSFNLLQYSLTLNNTTACIQELSNTLL